MHEDDNDFVVTSRPHGFPRLDIPQADVLVIRPFTADQAKRLLDRWYLATARHATRAGGKAQTTAALTEASAKADRLLTLIRANQALTALADNPLLLTMIAVVHWHRRELPDSRAELYKEMCEVILSRRIQDKGLPELLPELAKHELVAALAYQMMARPAEVPSARRAREVLRQMLSRRGDPVSAQEFLADMSHNGLLVESGEHGYAFAHQTFTEYLAAWHVSNNPSLVPALVDAVDEDDWRETIQLYAAICKDPGKIIRACLESATIRALALAFDCAEAREEKLSPDLLNDLRLAHGRAFRPECEQQYRRLIAGVMAARLAGRTLTTSAGARICDGPVQADLFQLFRNDTRAVPPGHPYEPDLDSRHPATGVWGNQAQAFTAWLNHVAADYARTGSPAQAFRLPADSELGEPAITQALGHQLPDPVTCLWTQLPQDAATPGLWRRPGKPRPPRAVSGEAILQAVDSDTYNTEILSLVLAAVTLEVILAAIIVLGPARTRAANLVSLRRSVAGIAQARAAIPRLRIGN